MKWPYFAFRNHELSAVSPTHQVRGKDTGWVKTGGAGGKTSGTGSVSSAVCDNHIGRLEAGCKLVLYPAVKEQL